MNKFNKKNVKIITLMDGTRVQIPEGSMTSSGGLKDRIYSSDKGDLLREDIVRKLSFKKGGRADKMPKRNKKNFRPTEKGAGMTRAGVAAYRRANPGSKLKTAVTGKVKPGSKAAKRRKSFCARSAGQMKKFPKAAKDPNSRLRQARRRWKC
jgi:hypothetical protein